MSEVALREKYRNHLGSIPRSQEEADEFIMELRSMVMKYGIPEDEEQEFKDRMKRCTLRARIWKILLGVGKTDPDEYFGYLQRGKEGFEKNNEKLYKDLHRSWGFLKEVDFELPNEEASARLLNAYFQEGLKKHREMRTYQQNVLFMANVFLHVMPELDAYHSFIRFAELNKEYLIATEDGSKIPGLVNGSKLVDLVLSNVGKPGIDVINKANEILHQKDVYPSTMMGWMLGSFHSNSPPLSNVVHLWDYFVAFGFSTHIYVAVAELIIKKDRLRDILFFSSTERIAPDWRLLYEFASSVAVRPEQGIAEAVYKHTHQSIPL